MKQKVICILLTIIILLIIVGCAPKETKIIEEEKAVEVEEIGEKVEIVEEKVETLEEETEETEKITIKPKEAEEIEEEELVEETVAETKEEKVEEKEIEEEMSEEAEEEVEESFFFSEDFEANAKLKKVLDEGTDKIESLNYQYIDPLNYPSPDVFYVKDEMIKIALYEGIDFSRKDRYYQTVYLNTTSKAAIGYCEAGKIRCEDYNKKYEVSYDQYIRKTPLDWRKDIFDPELLSSEMLDGRRAFKISFSKPYADYVIWVDDFFGVPLRVEYKTANMDEPEVYRFNQMAINSLTKEDVIHTVE